MPLLNLGDVQMDVMSPLSITLHHDRRVIVMSTPDVQLFFTIVIISLQISYFPISSQIVVNYSSQLLQVVNFKINKNPKNPKTVKKF